MSDQFEIRDDETLTAGIRRVALYSLDDAIARLGAADRPSDETVHEARKRLKEVRALLRLRPVSRTLPVALRDAGRRFADARDARAVIDTFDKLTESLRGTWGEVPLRRVRDALVGRKEEIDVPSSDDVLATLRSVRGQIQQWDERDDRFIVVADGYRRSYRRARGAMRNAYDRPRPPLFHEWRKRVKDLWHETEALGLTDIIVRGEEDPLHDLARRLGEHHDLTRLRETCRSFPPGVIAPALLRDIERRISDRSGTVERKARRIGRPVFGEPASDWILRIEAHWLLRRAARPRSRLAW